jgi:Flavodoxins
MKTKIFSIIALLFLALVSCSNKQIKAEVKHPKILVVYFSQGGNTKMLASTIKESTGGDLFSIEPTPPYPSGDIHDLVQKQIDKGTLPILKTKVKNLNSYNVIFVGTPNWYNSISLPVKSFLKENKLTGKVVVPFSTFGGSAGNTLTDIASLCPHSIILEGFSVSGDDMKNKPQEVKKNVSIWLNKIKAKF